MVLVLGFSFPQPTTARGFIATGVRVRLDQFFVTGPPISSPARSFQVSNSALKLCISWGDARALPNYANHVIRLGCVFALDLNQELQIHSICNIKRILR